MLGEKIKQLRLQKKMTQEQLAGDTITRNMLSLIEHGHTQPSISTMEEIAERLGAPLEYFFSENGELDTFRKIEAIGKIKKLYAAGDYAKCLSRLTELGVSDDETELMWAGASLACGIMKYRSGCLKSALSYLEASLSHAEKTIYAGREITDTAVRYRNMVNYICGKETAQEAREEDGKNAGLLADIAYIDAISGAREALQDVETCPLYAEHLAARDGMETSEEAHLVLEKLRGILERCDEERYAVLKYYVLCDMETLAGRLGDYKCAYECSSERRALTEKMNK